MPAVLVTSMTKSWNVRMMTEKEAPVPEDVTITKGTCFALFAYDVGLSINLTDAEQRIIAGAERGRLRHKTRAPQYFEYRPAPLRLVQEGNVFDISQYQASPTIEVMAYDFGAVTITYRFSLDGPFDRLLELSESLYENERLLTESRGLRHGSTNQTLIPIL
jgi:hypothetical protein